MSTDPPHAAPTDAPAALRVHGGLDLAETSALGIDPATVLDVSASVNPFGPSPVVQRAIRGAPVDVYPDPRCTEARAALARACRTTPDRVVLGNGATELLWTVARVLLAPGDAMVVCEPAFSELGAAAVHAGARVIACRGGEEQGFRSDPADAVRIARRHGARVVALCMPSSPVGELPAVEPLLALVSRNADLVFVLDQSFLALSTHAELRTAAMPDNVICVRSLTKEHAIPGVRVGYLLAAPERAHAVEVARPAWTVGSAAQAAAVASEDADDLVAATRVRLLSDAVTLANALRALGYEVLPSDTTYFVVRVGDAAAFRRALLCGHRVLVRDCTSFGMPAWVRVAARGGEDARRIVAGFAELAAAFAPRRTSERSRA